MTLGDMGAEVIKVEKPGMKCIVLGYMAFVIE